MSENNSKKESNVKNKPQEQEKGKSGGFVGSHSIPLETTLCCASSLSDD